MNELKKVVSIMLWLGIKSNP